MINKIVFSIFLLVSSSVFGDVSYSKDELKILIELGTYPPLVKKYTALSSELEFESCIRVVNDKMEMIGSEYPIHNVINTKLLYWSKYWVENKTVNLACSSLDNKFIKTIFKYSLKIVPYERFIGKNKTELNCINKSRKKDISYIVKGDEALFSIGNMDSDYKHIVGSLVRGASSDRLIAKDWHLILKSKGNVLMNIKSRERFFCEDKTVTNLPS